LVEFPNGIEITDKVLNFKIGFQHPEKVSNLAKIYILSTEKALKFSMEKKSEASGQNFVESKAVHYLRSIMQCVKFSFMIKNF